MGKGKMENGKSERHRFSQLACHKIDNGGGGGGGGFFLSCEDLGRMLDHSPPVLFFRFSFFFF